MGKAIVLREHGNSNVLKLEDIEIKKPKENELLIRQTAIGVHFLETLAIIMGGYLKAVQYLLIFKIHLTHTSKADLKTRAIHMMPKL